MTPAVIEMAADAIERINIRVDRTLMVIVEGDDRFTIRRNNQVVSDLTGEVELMGALGRIMAEEFTK